MNKQSWAHLAALVMWLLPIGYLIKVFPSLPEMVPVHFGLEGKPDRYGGKDELVQLTAILSVVTAGIYLLIRFLPKIDPKKMARYSGDAFKKIAFALVIFLSALQLFMIHSAISQSLSVIKFLFPLIGLFFAYLGNLMHSIKPNYFVGIRTPWTLEDADTWRATHQLAGKLWFTGGIIITMVTLLLPAKAGGIFFIAAAAFIALIPVIYSYLYFKKTKH
jgi:uncharacterized membrane protein